MVIYICERCLHEYKKKSQYEYHINRKYKCDVIQPNINNVDTSNSNKMNIKNSNSVNTLYSNNINTSNNNINNITLNLILEELKNVKNKLANVEEDNKQLKEDNKKTNKKLQKLEDNTKSSQNIINDNGSVNNNGIINNNKNINKGVVNINIVAFGKENMDFVIDDIGELCQGNKTVSNLINYMHFNKNKPENHNVYMPNRKNKSEVFVHNGVKWIIADKNAVVEQLIDKGIEYVEGKLEELSTIISQSKYNAVERAIDIYNDSEHELYNETTKKITKDIELILYNNKDLILSPKIK